METKEYLEQLHQTLLEILDYVCGVCEENHLSYFLAYGTALGACRHQGFIPWDDDLDICMPVDDYFRLIKIIQEHPDSGFSVQSADNEENYFLTFIKVRKNGTLFRESMVDGMYRNNGIFIDVLPVYYLDGDKKDRYKKAEKRAKSMAHALRFLACRDFYREKQGKLFYLANCVITSPYRKKKWKTMLEEIQGICMQYGEKDTAKYLIAMDEFDIFPYEMIFPLSKVTFAGKEYTAPGNLHEYLRMRYGENYMTLPPVEQRATHMPLEVRFKENE